MTRKQTLNGAHWPDLTSEIPGLERVSQALTSEPKLSRILQRLDEVELELRHDLTEHQLARHAGTLQRIIVQLLAFEERLWHDVTEDIPWATYKWLAHAATWVGAARVAHTYVEKTLEVRKDQALLALESGVHYATESAMAYARFVAERNYS
ncbi:MAG: hypothetical protein ACR2JC_08505 [Chloroflexota bacterium]|nr:MAG: hypothetical protein DLM70_15205 [Chloroflexota bacterium]